MMVLTAIALALVLFASPLAVDAQPAGKVQRIGVLSAVTRELSAPRDDRLRQGLRELGYVEGQNIAFEWRYADGRAERFSELVAELVQLKVDVILAANNPAVKAAQRATTTIPIVMVFGSDPVAMGFVASLARPGGNITGFSGQTQELIGKRLQLLKDAVPQLSRVAILWDPAHPGIRAQVGEAEAAASALGLQLQLVEAQSANALDGAFGAMTRQGAQAVLVLGSSMHSVHRARIAELARKNRLPSGCLLREYAESGCLMSYSPDFIGLWRHAAIYIAKILKGEKPADLPVQQPTKFELVVNLKTAKALELTIPQSLLVQADRVVH